MTAEELIEEFNKRLSLIENEVIEPDEETLFLKNFLENNSDLSLESIAKINITQMFMAHTLTWLNADFEKIDIIFNRLKPLLENPELTRKDLSSVLKKIVSTHNDLVKNDESNSITKGIKKFSINQKLIKSLKKHGLDETYLDSANAFMELLDLMIDEVINSDEECSLDEDEKRKVLESTEKLAEGIHAINIIKTAQGICSNTGETIILNCDNEPVDINDKSFSKKDRNNLFRKIMKSEEFKDFISEYKKITAYYNAKQTAINKRIRVKNKKSLKYREFLALFQKQVETPGEITNYRTLLASIPDQDLQLLFLNYVYRNNLAIAETVQEEYHRIFSPEVSAYAQILSSFSMPNNKEFLECVTSRYTKEELQEALAGLKKIKITNPEDIYKILSISNSQTISLLKSLTEKEIIPSEFYKSHMSIFSTDSNVYSTVLENINTFTTNNINPKYLYSNTSILLVDSIAFKKRIDLLREENLLGSIKKDSDISFFAREELAERLALIGKSKYMSDVREDISLLNASNVKWKRAIVMESIDMPVSKEDLPAFLDNDDFFIPDSKIDSYIQTLPEISKPSTK